MTHVEVIGWFGSFFLSICAAPQVYMTWKTKSAKDLSFMFLLLWFIGEIFSFYYISVLDYYEGVTHWPLYINYIVNILALLYLFKAKWNENGPQKKQTPP